VIVADSSIWIEALRGGSSPALETFKVAAQDGQVVVGDLVLLEVLQGARNDPHADLLERAMRRHPVVSLLEGDLPRKAAANYRALRSLGVTVKKTVDLIIATYCLERDHILLHQDRDYTHFVKHLGLRVL
jgi:predicted nucleic acid-binding protein